MIKKIGSFPFVQSVLGYLAFLFCVFLLKTNRWTIEGWPEELENKKQSFLLLFWHGRLFSGTPTFMGQKPKMPYFVLSSLHRDGQILASTMSRFGAGSINGSSSKGGIKAALAIRKALKKGSIVAVTPDGHKPGYKMTSGMIYMARDSGCPLVPSAFSVSRGRRLNSWDRILFPFPFGRGIMLFGEPIYVPKETKEEDIENWRQFVENKINEITIAADARVGLPPDQKLTIKDVRL